MSEAWQYEDLRPAAGEVMFEMATLGAAMLGSRQMHDAADLLPADDFTDPNRGAAWTACIELTQAGEQINAQAVAGKLSPRVLNALGGPVGLFNMTTPEVAPLPGQLLEYAGKVRDIATRKRLRVAVAQISRSLDERDDVSQAVEDARQAIDEAAGGLVTTEGAVSAAEMMDAAIDWLEVRQVGAATPWRDVTEKTNGLVAGQMVVVAARPGHGKSIVAKDVALATARSGKAVHIATLEMSRNEYMTRILCGIAGADLGRAMRRELSDVEWTEIGKAAAQVRELPLWIDDRETQTMASIRAAARTTMRRKGELGLIAIDYAQLITPGDRRMPREQQVAEISRQTKLLAKEFHCPVMLLAQLNRGNTARAEKTPMVSDLRESGSLEQDADQVWLLHRQDQYGDERMGEVDLIVGKNRNGPAPTTIALTFQGHYGRITSMGRE